MKEFLRSIIVSILVFEAKVLLKRKKPKIIAITGSVGKTSTKDAIYSAVRVQFHTRKSEKTYNSDIGVSLTILGLRTGWSNPIHWLKNILDGALTAFFARGYPELLVLELGIDRPGDMKRLTSFIKPDIAIVTRLPDVPTHVEFFSSPEEVAHEKLRLVEALKPDGVFVYNNDDQKLRDYASEVRHQAFGFSRYSPSHFTASGDSIIYDGGFPDGIEFTVAHIDESAKVRVRGSLGVQHAYNYAAALAVARILGIPLKEGAQALQDNVTPRGRMKLLYGTKGTLVIDDTYNSSPVACEHAVQTLKELTGVKRKIAVLGDMLELGQFSVREHEHIGALVAGAADILLTVGLRSRKIAEGALEHGMNEKNIFQYDEVDRAGNELMNMLQTGDVVLVKASQSIRAEKLVEKILNDPKKAAGLLVRQDSFWTQKL